MRWLALALVVLAGCDALFQLDELKPPSGDGGNGDGDGGITTADAVDAEPGARFVQQATTLGMGQFVGLPILGMQSDGNANLLFISWTNTAENVTTVDDTLGNDWKLAFGRVIAPGTAQAVYFADNIKPGTNAVTVTFSAAVTSNLRLLEYHGIYAMLDSRGDASTAGTTMSGSMIALNRPALLIAGFATYDTLLTPGPGFTERVKSAKSYVEDMETTTANNYKAVATQGSSGPYVVHLLAFATQP